MNFELYLLVDFFKMHLKSIFLAADHSNPNTKLILKANLSGTVCSCFTIQKTYNPNQLEN